MERAWTLHFARDNSGLDAAISLQTVFFPSLVARMVSLRRAVPAARGSGGRGRRRRAAFCWTHVALHRPPAAGGSHLTATAGRAQHSIAWGTGRGGGHRVRPLGGQGRQCHAPPRGPRRLPCGWPCIDWAPCPPPLRRSCGTTTPAAAGEGWARPRRCGSPPSSPGRPSSCGCRSAAVLLTSACAPRSSSSPACTAC